MAGTKWDWAHDGTKNNGVIEFLYDGTTRWNNGKTQGFWKVKENGTVLETKFNGIYHKLKYLADEKKAVLMTPIRTPASTMMEKGEWRTN